jgi:N-acetylglutamate synthase-like GNAT family acetyltransferase
MKDAMDKRIEWIKTMMKIGLEIFVALEPPRNEIIHYKWAGKINHADLAIKGKVPMGLLEYLPIEHALEPVVGKNSLFINCIWILPPFWKKGVGSALIDAFLKTAQKVGAASVISYEQTKWFETSIDYMPTKFFQKYGFIEADRDEGRILLFKDFKSTPAPRFIQTNLKTKPESKKNIMNIFCNDQCPWSAYMIQDIRDGLKHYKDVNMNRIFTNTRKSIEQWGISRGICLNNKILSKRMASWNQIKRKIDEFKLT